MGQIIVQKYGGTSVASVERINKVADNIKAYLEKGYSLVVVVSAMGERTDKLINYAHKISENPSRREQDVLLSSGEQVTSSLLAMALHHRNVAAHSYMGWQLPIKTDHSHTNARVLEVNNRLIKKYLKQGYVIVVPGFQGINSNNDITTLGRGGSDTTAVALAASLKAQECQIYTDVDGIYTADPRIEQQARMMSKITLEEMLELAGVGSKVLHSRSVGLAASQKVPLRVLSGFKEGLKQQGTLVIQRGDKEMEQNIVSGIAHNRNEAKILIQGVPNTPGIAAKILEPLSEAGIEVDMIVQNAGVGRGKKATTDFTFTVARADYKRSHKLMNELGKKMGAQQVKGDATIAKVSIVGWGMKSHAGVASTMFKTLAKEGINIQIISTSEIKVSVIVEEKYVELAVRSLHQAFNLHKK